MNKKQISGRIDRMRKFFESGATKDISYRKKQLRMLKKAIRKNEDLVMEALYRDMKKPPFEAYAGEIGILYPEITHAIRKLRSWSRNKRVATPVIHFYSSSHVYYEPYGVALIIGPWNYPFQLTIAPLIAAMAAGNCAVIKPSELAPATSKCIARIIKETFPDNYITVIEGDAGTAGNLLAEKFDYIFFTGGTAVGRIVMRAAAEHLTPVTLELGGKSPVIVDEDADIRYAARRLCWGKFFNAGQTCLAPDYLLVHEKIREAFVMELVRTIDGFYNENPLLSDDYARIINNRHFDRITRLMKKGRVLYGGETLKKDLYISPTLIDRVTLKDPIMQEEIFGPLLPIMGFASLDEAIGIVNSRPRPLALYYFSKGRRGMNRILRETISGGGCINDTVSHVGSTTLPFGGIGDSGMGSYHGRSGFETFSHRRGVLKRSNLIDISLRYPPYGRKVSLLRKLFRIVR